MDTITSKLFDIKRKTMQHIEQKQEPINNFKLSDLNIIPISPDIAILYISSNHYSKTCTRAISLAFGIYYNKMLVGCIVYAEPVGTFVVQSIAKGLELKATNVYELTRLFIDDKIPNNAESYCIAKTIQYIKQNRPEVYYLISYADTMYGHCGCIYQATNWLYTGSVEPKAMFKYRNKFYHARTMYAKYGSSSIPHLKNILGNELKVVYSKCKNRYIYVLGCDKREHKLLMNELSYKILPYPKQDIRYYKMV